LYKFVHNGNGMARTPV